MYELVTTATPEDVGLSTNRLGQVSDWMRRQVDAGVLPGLTVAVSRRGEIAYVERTGSMDLEAGKALVADTIFRIYSMTKPIVSAAALMLYEEGCFQLDDPLSKFLPAFAEPEVLQLDDNGAVRLVAAARPITVRDLLSHTSGLVYGAREAGPIGEFYQGAGVDFSRSNAGISLAQMVDRVAELPLVCHPGSAWNYGISTDVVGRLVEVLSGKELDVFLAERIFAPLGMIDTGFHVLPEKHARLAACYTRPDAGGLELTDPPEGSRFAAPADLFSGGGGLVSTMADYAAFCRMMLANGQARGERLLGRKTVEYMTRNHLPGDMAAMGQPRFGETSFEGIGFGLGVAVMLDPARAQVIGSPGEYQWGGVAGTAFWIDPAEEMFVILMTQVMPSSALPLRRQLRVLTYQAIID